MYKIVSFPLYILSIFYLLILIFIVLIFKVVFNFVNIFSKEKNGKKLFKFMNRIFLKN